MSIKEKLELEEQVSTIECDIEHIRNLAIAASIVHEHDYINKKIISSLLELIGEKTDECESMLADLV